MTIEHLPGGPVTVNNRTQLKQLLKKHGVVSPYFSDMIGG